MLALVIIFVIVVFAVIAATSWSSTQCAPAGDRDVPAEFTSPPQYFEMVSDDVEPPSDQPDSALEREGVFYIDGDVIPKMGDSKELVDENADEASETIRAYDDTADGLLAEYQDARLQRNRELQSKSHSTERFEMTKKMVSREVEASVENGPWWDEPN